MAIKANTTGTDQDDSSVGAQIRQYLASQGLDYNAANVKAALARNARNTDQAGPDVIEGLRNYGVEAPSGSGAGGRPGGGGGSRGVSGAPPVDLGGNPGIETPDTSVGASPTTSAQPPGAGSDGSLLPALATAILGGGGLAAVDAINRGARRPGTVLTNPADPYGPPPPPPEQYGPPVEPRPSVEITPRPAEPPVAPPGARPPVQLPSGQADPMAAALDRAVAPAPAMQLPSGGTPPVAPPAAVAPSTPPPARIQTGVGRPMTGTGPVQSIIDSLVEAARAVPKAVRR